MPYASKGAGVVVTAGAREEPQKTPAHGSYDLRCDNTYLAVYVRNGKEMELKAQAGENGY